MSSDMAPYRMIGRILSMKYIYILLLENGQLYVGSTSNLKRCIKEHKSKNVRFTSKRQPIRLIHYEAYLLDSDALRREKF